MAIQVLDFYGAVVSDDVSAVFQVQPAMKGPADAPYVAKIVGAREYRINLTPVVIAPDGALAAWHLVQVAHKNPAGGERYRNFGSGSAEHFTATEAGTNGLQLGGGSKIGDGGPVDEIWVHGTMPDGGAIQSEWVKCGLYSSDIVLSPVYYITKRGGTTTPPIQPPTTGDPKAKALEHISHAQQDLFLARDAISQIP